MKRFYCLFLLFFIFFLSCNKDNASVTSIDIIRYGLYEQVEVVSFREATNDETLITQNFVEIKQKIKTITDEITPEIGTMFGVEFVIRGKPVGAEVEVEVFHKHPNMTGDDGQVFSVQNYKVIKKIEEENNSLYIFESDYELVKGEWKIHIITKTK